MNTTRIFIFILVGFLVISIFVTCTSKVLIDYESGVDFIKYHKYKTIRKAKDSNYSKTMNPYINKMNEKRFAVAIDKELKEKGFKRITEGEPDFKVIYYIRLMKKIDVASSGYTYWPDMGYHHRYLAGRVFEEGSLIIDIIDTEDDQLIWRGALEGALVETENISQVINKTVKKIMKKFPPKGKKVK